jgi:hypothetical protein
MKRLTIIATILLISTGALGQDSLSLEQLEKKVKKSHRMKTIGRPFTGVGGLLLFTGSLMLITNTDLLAPEQSSGFQAGGAMTGLGAIGLAIGLPMSMVGANNERKYRRLQIQKKFGALDEAAQEKLLNGEIWIGMTDEQARYCLGKPRKIIQMATNDSSHQEKWRYKDQELLILDGTLESFKAREKEYKETVTTY